MSLFPGIFIVPKIWKLISFSNQVYFANARATSYSPQKDLSNGVYHAPIKIHLTLAFKGFVVRSQIRSPFF